MKSCIQLLFIGYLLVMSLGHASAHGEEELANLMSRVQYYLDKTGLSISAQNSDLMAFYVHELIEAVESVEAVESHDGYAIGDLTKTVLSPALESLEKKIESANMRVIDTAYADVIDACNLCHIKTRHGFIEIKRNDTNPYMQSFD